MSFKNNNHAKLIEFIHVLIHDLRGQIIQMYHLCDIIEESLSSQYKKSQELRTLFRKINTLLLDLDARSMSQFLSMADVLDWIEENLRLDMQYIYALVTSLVNESDSESIEVKLLVDASKSLQSRFDEIREAMVHSLSSPNTTDD